MNRPDMIMLGVELGVGCATIVFVWVYLFQFKKKKALVLPLTMNNINEPGYLDQMMEENARIVEILRLQTALLECIRRDRS